MKFLQVDLFRPNWADKLDSDVRLLWFDADFSERS